MTFNNYNLQDYQFDLGHYLLYKNELEMDTPFQRGYVWSQEQKESFINYILLGLPFPAVYVTKDQRNIPYNRIIDGKQRLSAVFDFVDNKLTRKYSDFTDIEKRNFKAIGVLSKAINLPEKELVEFYILLNTAGIRHTTEDIDRAKEYLALLKIKSSGDRVWFNNRIIQNHGKEDCQIFLERHDQPKLTFLVEDVTNEFGLVRKWGEQRNNKYFYEGDFEGMPKHYQKITLKLINKYL